MRTTTTAIAISALSMACGCQSGMKQDHGLAAATDGRAAAPAPDRRGAESDSSRHSPGHAQDASDVAFAGTSEEMEDHTTGSSRHVSLIGLYGELVDRPAASTGKFDGAGNLSQVTSATEGTTFDPDVDRSGRWLVFASTQHRETSDIYLKSVNGRTQRQLTADPADDIMPAFSPDGHSVAFASNRQGSWDLYLTTTEGGPPQRLTDDPDHELHPSFSPDGTTLAYCKHAAHSGKWEIWTLDLQSNVRQFLAYGIFPSWNPDPARSKIAFQRARGRGSRLFSIWTLDYINGEATNQTEIVSAANAAVMHPSWSPDGSRLVFVTAVDPETADASALPAQSDLWIVKVDGSERTNITNGEAMNLTPVWSSDGTVYFRSSRSGVDNIWAVETARTVDLMAGEDDMTATHDDEHAETP